MKLTLLSTAFVLLASHVSAQHAHPTTQVGESGQSQFAAIAEIVSVLRDDPDTNWAKVDIKALRDHLVDMDNVTTKASVDRSVSGLSMVFSITGDATVAGSIQRMVLAHGKMLQNASDWIVKSEKQTDGAKMTVVVRSENELDQVKGLGFFGLMTIGAHHQRHHVMIAKGHSPH